MSAIWTFDSTKNKHDVYKGDYYMEKFRECLKGTQ